MTRMLSHRGGTAAVAAALTLSLAGPASAAPARTTVLSQDLGVRTPIGTSTRFSPCPPNPKNWCVQQTRFSGAVEIRRSLVRKAGPASLFIGTPDRTAITDRAYALNTTLAGKPLSSLTTLAYQSYVITRSTADARQAPVLQITVDPDGSGPNLMPTFLLWDPRYAAQHCGGKRVAVGVWQAWTPSAACGWWSPFNTSVTPPGQLTATGAIGTMGFAQRTATFAQVKAALRNMRILAVGINQGISPEGGNPGLSSNVDLLKVNNTTYDFEARR